MITARQIELLAPAKELVYGMEAIRHGADAVYIGSPKFGARAAAGNSIEDIRALCDFAHLYDARVYVALNTILKEDELLEAERLIHQLYRAGADALIIQDMGITRLELPPIPLHASTQTDNSTLEKVRFLAEAGFQQVVLARELTIEEMRQIAQAVPIRLEAFVHGSLCVSYSGRCYLSEALGGRSANRGVCAQSCRLPWTLIDADRRVIVKDKHLLSLKDLHRANELEAMIEAGITSFKIEGRLKELSYVKNITAYYRQRLDALLENNPSLCRSSVGSSSFTFEPQPEKSFNRGFTPYFSHGRKREITSFDTPKSIGEKIGRVKEVHGHSLTVVGEQPLHNGDGLVYFNSEGKLEGCRVNRVEKERFYPFERPAITPGVDLYRNYDHLFEQQLAKSSAERKIKTELTFREVPFGFSLTIKDETGAAVTIAKQLEKVKANNPQQGLIERQLMKLGNTPFAASKIDIALCDHYFIPSSLLNEMRREAVECLLSVRRIRYRRPWVKKTAYDSSHPYPQSTLDYTANITNSKAESFYMSHGVRQLEQGFELRHQQQVALMYTKHCIRYSMGWCPRYQQRQSSFKEPLFLCSGKRRLRLGFDCENCRMLVYDDVQ